MFLSCSGSLCLLHMRYSDRVTCGCYIALPHFANGYWTESGMFPRPQCKDPGCNPGKKPHQTAKKPKSIQAQRKTGMAVCQTREVRIPSLRADVHKYPASFYDWAESCSLVGHPNVLIMVLELELGCGMNFPKLRSDF